jgi:hypothetical protein
MIIARKMKTLSTAQMIASRASIEPSARLRKLNVDHNRAPPTCHVERKTRETLRKSDCLLYAAAGTQTLAGRAM